MNIEALDKEEGFMNQVMFWVNFGRICRRRALFSHDARLFFDYDDDGWLL